MLWAFAFTIPLVGALIGWVTNMLAVKLIFWPQEPLRLWGYSLGLQGLLPRRRKELARSIGKTVEAELLSFDDLVGQVRNIKTTRRLSAAVKEAAQETIMQRTPGIVPNALKKMFAETVAESLRKQTPKIIGWLTDEVALAARGEIKISHLVEERMNSFPLKDLEQVVFRVAAKEIKHITVLGGVLGFVIGVLQVGVLYLYQMTGFL